jgi:DnaK suppressor protein
MPDPLDAAKEVEEEQLWLAVLDRRDEIRGQIKEAVELLSEGRYGRCVECNMPIPAARLQALPFAVRCLACQERFETQSSQVAVLHSSA